MYVTELVTKPLGSPQLTLRHLLTMKAGLPQDDPYGDRLLDQPQEQFSALLANGVSHSSLPRTPVGTEFEYSNLAYSILGLVITRVTGMAYQRYIKKAILDPLGMHNTTFDVTALPENHIARGHSHNASIDGAKDGKTWRSEPLLGDGQWGAMGGLWTTVEDFAKYMKLHQSAWQLPHPGHHHERNEEPAVLCNESLREMHLPATFIGLFANEKHPTSLEAGKINLRATDCSWPHLYIIYNHI
jgi:CubicO group peptidase (beta-lactamase class C family)